MQGTWKLTVVLRWMMLNVHINNDNYYNMYKTDRCLEVNDVECSSTRLALRSLALSTASPPSSAPCSGNQHYCVIHVITSIIIIICVLKIIIIICTTSLYEQKVYIAKNIFLLCVSVTRLSSSLTSSSTCWSWGPEVARAKWRVRDWHRALRTSPQDKSDDQLFF